MLNSLKLLAQTSSFPLFASIMGIALLFGWALWNLLKLSPGMFVGGVVFFGVMYPIWRWLRRS